MHEYSIVAALLERVEAEAASRRATAVHHVRVRIGELAGIEPDLFVAAFEMCREHGVCAGADLEIVPAETHWKCPGCGAGIAAGAILQCPECALPARLEGGHEILLERIEMEVP